MSASYGSCKDSLPVLESVDASARLIIDLKALAANYGTLSKATNAGVAGVVKANAYGVPGELIFTHNGPVCSLMWSTKSGHRVKVVKCHNEVNDDNRKKKAKQLHGRFQARCSGAGYGAGLQDFRSGRSLDVGANLIGRWRRQFEEEASGVRLSGDEREELKRLRKEVRQLRMEKEILKKASQFFAKEMK